MIVSPESVLEAIGRVRKILPMNYLILMSVMLLFLVMPLFLTTSLTYGVLLRTLLRSRRLVLKRSSGLGKPGRHAQ